MTPEELAAIRARDAQTEFYPMFTAADIIGQRPEYDRRALLNYVDELLRQRAAVEEFGRDQAKPFADGVPDREGEAVWAGIQKALGR